MGPSIRNAKQRRRRPPQLHERPLALVVARRHDAKVLALGLAPERLGKDAIVLRGLDEGTEGGVARCCSVCALGSVEERDTAWLLCGIDHKVGRPGHLLHHVGGDVAVWAVIFGEEEGVVSSLAAD